MTAREESKNRKRKTDQTSTPMLFAAINYKLMILGIFLVVAGFTAMYLENEVWGFISLYISPIVILSGYMTVVVAILKRNGVQPSSGG